MERSMQVETADYNGLDANWQDNVAMSKKYSEHCQNILDTLAEFKHMREVRLGRMDMAKH